MRRIKIIIMSLVARVRTWKMLTIFRSLAPATFQITLVALWTVKHLPLVVIVKSKSVIFASSLYYFWTIDSFYVTQIRVFEETDVTVYYIWNFRFFTWQSKIQIRNKINSLPVSLGSSRLRIVFDSTTKAYSTGSTAYWSSYKILPLMIFSLGRLIFRRSLKPMNT